MLRNILVLLTFIAMALVARQALTAEETHLERALRESGQASIHASASAAHALVASGQATLAVSAVPLSIGGAVLTTVGNASTAAANSMQKAASAPIGTPLPITEESIINTPPDQALKP